MTWTEEQARALITDPGTLKRGQELAAPAKWGNLGQTDTAAWGECKGSGSKPYQTGIDLTEPAFKCSCPSRVFPCKHGAGLLLLLARQPQLLSGPTPPAWLQEWLEKRQQTQEKKVVKAAEASDEAAQNESSGSPLSTGEGGRGGEASLNDAARQKREAQRQTRMQRGAQELETWLVDLIRAGLAATDQQPHAYWETQAARLVDNQLPGLAAVVRELPTLRHQGTDWPTRLLTRLGELYLLVCAFQRLPELTEDARQEVLQQVGVSLKKEDVQATQPAVADEWHVLDLTTTEEERLTVRRAWLRGRQTGRFALLVDFAFGQQPFAPPLVPDGHYAGELTFYPGLLPLRAIAGPLTFRGVPPGNPGPTGGIGPAQLLTDYADALARLPWLREWPALLTGGVPTPTAAGWVLRFPPAPPALTTPATLPPTPEIRLLCDDLFGWELRAISGGEPLTVFGEWTGQALRPLVGWDAGVELQTT